MRKIYLDTRIFATKYTEIVWEASKMGREVSEICFATIYTRITPDTYICMCLVWFACIWDIIYIEKWRARWERGDQYFVVFSDSCESTWIQCSWNKFGLTYLYILRIWTYLDAPKYDNIKIRNTTNLNLSVSKQLAPKPVRFM